MKITNHTQFALPESPGVYLFKKGKDILYIGKATSLRDRTRSYFSSDLISSRGVLLVDMVAKADTIEHITTDSVLEALILEAHLIKTHLPYYNTKEKDNKSWNYVVITKEEFPRVLLVRGRVLDEEWKQEDRLHTFGPFPYGGSLKEALKLIRKIFPFRDRCEPHTKACFNHQIGLCPGVCDDSISKKEYMRIIRHLTLFFQGKKTALVKSLEKEMRGYAKLREFEKAAVIKRRIYALQHIQDVSLIKKETVANGFRIEAYDVAHISGTDLVGSMVVVEDNVTKQSDYRKFKIKTVDGVNDVASLREILERRLGHLEWRMPDLIVVDGSLPQRNAALDILQNKNLTIPVVAVTKNDAHKPKAILGDETLIKTHQKAILLANSEAHRFAIRYHRSLRRL